jgi:beta-glucanase (GH16 family)
MNILEYPKFIRPLISVFLCIASIFLSLAGRPTIPHGRELDMSKFELTWSDEFDGDKLDLTKWDGDTIIRRGSYWNNSLATVSDGSLHIATKYYPDGLNGNGKPGWYTSGIDTRRSYEQQYGYFECRCILPKGTGLWSAFWMFCSGVGKLDHDGELGAEIDIYESPYYHLEGVDGNSVASNIHINGYGEEHRTKSVCHSRVTANNPYEEFNTYGLEWNEKGYIFYINGVEAGRTRFGVSKVPEWMILSVEVDGANGEPADGWSGAAVDAENPPTDFVVDYVRAYQYK